MNLLNATIPAPIRSGYFPWFVAAFFVASFLWRCWREEAICFLDLFFFCVWLGLAQDWPWNKHGEVWK